METRTRTRVYVNVALDSHLDHVLLSQKWHLIGKCYSALYSHLVVSLMNSWTHGTSTVYHAVDTLKELFENVEFPNIVAFIKYSNFYNNVYNIVLILA